MDFQSRRTMTPRKFVLVASLLLAVLGVSVLLGWAFGIATLKSVFPGLATMKANTAAAILLCGVSLALLSWKTASKRIRRWVATLALLVVAVGAMTLAEYLFGWELRIDQALFVEAAGSMATPYSGRMSPSTALCFVFAGTALFVASLRYAWRWRWPILSALGAAVALLGAIALVAYLLDAFLYFHIWNYRSRRSYRGGLRFARDRIASIGPWRRRADVVNRCVNDERNFDRHCVSVDGGRSLEQFHLSASTRRSVGQSHTRGSKGN